MLATLVGASGLAAQTAAASTEPARHRRVDALEAYGTLPLAFEANRGQTHRDVRFLARGMGYNLFLTGSEVVLSLSPPAGPRSEDGRPVPPDEAPFGDRGRGTVVRMRLLDANPTAAVIGHDPLRGKVNYFRGPSAAWKTGIPIYAAVSYREVYPGVDVVFYGNQGRLEHDFIVQPGVDPGAIQLQIDGAESLSIDADGDLVLVTEAGNLRLERPRLYQDAAGGRTLVEGEYLLRSSNTVAFEVGSYDPSRALVIDPILVYSTFVGGTGQDQLHDVAVDALGQAHVTGATLSADFPVANAADSTANGGWDLVVAKLDATGSTLLYSTYLGGTNDESGSGGIALDALGNAYVAAGTRSTDFPITAGAPDGSCGGCYNFPGPSDATVTKLDGTGAIVYSTLIGGNEYETAYSVAVDVAGNAYVSGGIAYGYASCTFPIVNGYDNCANSYYDAFLTKVDATGTAFLYSTTLGGGNDDYCGCDVAVDVAGNAVMTGMTRSIDFPTTGGAYDAACGTSFAEHNGIFDAFALKINTNAAGAASLVYSTCIGGGLDDSGSGVVVDGTGRIWLTGATQSADFPTVNPADGSANGNGDAFIAEIDPLAIGSAQVVYGTYLGGGASDGGNDLALEPSGIVWVTGTTASSDFPTQDFIQVHQGGNDVFATKLDPALAGSAQILFSTYLGGCESDVAGGIALDPLGNAYLAGATSSALFPVTMGALENTYGGNEDGFVAKISGSGPSVEVSGCLPPTATLLSLFEMRRTSEGLEVRWAFSDGADIAALSLERSEWTNGPWRSVDAEPRDDGGVTVAVDRGAEPGRTYYYRLVVRTLDGRILTFGPVMERAGGTSTDFGLVRVMPNPTPGETQIEFAVARAARIRLGIVDVQGREVAVLAEGLQPAGRYHAAWDGRLRTGAAPAGLYFVRYRYPGGESMRRLILMP